GPPAPVLQRRPEPAPGRGPGRADRRRAGRPPRRPGPVRREAAAARPRAARRVLRGVGGRSLRVRPPRPVRPERLQLAADHPPRAVRVHRPHPGPGSEARMDPMNEPEPLQDLIDDYLDGLLDEARTRALEERLCADADARRNFVRYSRLHTDLHLEVRARRAGAQALDRIARLDQERAAPVAARRRRFSLKALAAACLVFALGAGAGRAI